MSGYDRFCEMQDEYRRKIRKLCNNLLKQQCIHRSRDLKMGKTGSLWRVEALRDEVKFRGLE